MRCLFVWQQTRKPLKLGKRCLILATYKEATYTGKEMPYMAADKEATYTGIEMPYMAYK